MIISMTAVIPSTPATAPIIIGNGIVGSPSELGGSVIVGMELLLMVGLVTVGVVMVLLGCTDEGSGPPKE